MPPPGLSAGYIARREALANPAVYTGRTRRRWGFFTQFEVEGPVYRSRWQTPYNVSKWPREKYWTYQRPDR